MDDSYLSYFVAGIPFLLLVATGLWISIQRQARDPVRYHFTTAAFVVAPILWLLRPFVTDWPQPMQLSRIDDGAILYDSLAASVTDGLPLCLLYLIFRGSPRSEFSPQTRAATAAAVPRRWIVIGILTTSVLAALLAFWVPHYRFAFIGAGPYLLFLAASLYLCLLSPGREAGSRLAVSALVAALATWFTRPWLATSLHLLFYERTPIWNFDGFDYEAEGILHRTTLFFGTLYDCVPLLLMSLAVFRSAAEVLVKSSSAPAECRGDRTASGLPDLRPPDLRRQEKIVAKILAGIGWSLLGGTVSTVLFVGAMIAYIVLFVPSQKGGHATMTTEEFVLILGILPAFLVGVFGGIVIAAKRARRAKPADPEVFDRH